MIALTQITTTKIFAFITVLVFKLLGCNVLFIYSKNNKNYSKVGYFFYRIANFTGKLLQNYK